MYICMYVCMYVYTGTLTRDIHTYIHTYIRIYIHTYMHTHTHVIHPSMAWADMRQQVLDQSRDGAGGDGERTESSRRGSVPRQVSKETQYSVKRDLV